MVGVQLLQRGICPEQIGLELFLEFQILTVLAAQDARPAGQKFTGHIRVMVAGAGEYKGYLS